MSTSLLYHGFGIRGYKYVNTRYEGGAVHFMIAHKEHNLRCCDCGNRDVVRRGTVMRRFRNLPIGNKPSWVVLDVQRVWCIACNLVRQVKIGFADERRSYTRALERYVLELSRHMTIRGVSQHLGIGWDMVKDIQKRHLKKRFSKPKLHKLTQIAIDEISVKKGHNYLTIVLDLLTGMVVFVGDGKGANALDPFWQRLKRTRNRIRAVAIDMSPAYISAVINNLPDAAIVFDHFHVIKLLNKQLTELRRKLYNEVTDRQQKEVIKGTRWLLLKNPGDLDESKNEFGRLQKALKMNQPLATAYYLKESLSQLWDQLNKSKAIAWLKDWCAQAQQSKIPLLMKFANTIAVHRTGILAYYDFPISTGPLEGINNKIKTMKRQAYGFRDMGFFKLKILGLHQTKYALIG